MESKKSTGRSGGPVELWSLREDVLVEEDPERPRLVIVSRWGEMGIDSPDDLVRESLRRMILGPIILQNIRAGIEHHEWANLHGVLDTLGGSVVRSLGLPEDGLLLSAIPVARHASLRPHAIEPTLPLRLSRFAAMRAVQGELQVESPLGQYHVTLHQPLACHVVTGMSAVTTVQRLAELVHATPELVGDMVSYLAATGIALVGEWTNDKAR